MFDMSFVDACSDLFKDFTAVRKRDEVGFAMRAERLWVTLIVKFASDDFFNDFLAMSYEEYEQYIALLLSLFNEKSKN